MFLFCKKYWNWRISRASTRDSLRDFNYLDEDVSYKLHYNAIYFTADFITSITHVYHEFIVSLSDCFPMQMSIVFDWWFAAYYFVDCLIFWTLIFSNKYLFARISNSLHHKQLNSITVKNRRFFHLRNWFWPWMTSTYTFLWLNKIHSIVQLDGTLLLHN